MNPISLPEAWVATAAALRARREALGLSLSTLADRTCIGHYHLTAIEAARFDRCGAPVYAIGFARALARALDLPEAPVIAAVRAGIAERTPAPAPMPHRAPRRLIPSLGLATTATMVLSLVSGLRGG